VSAKSIDLAYTARPGRQRPNRGVGEKRPPRGGGSGAAKSEIWQWKAQTATMA